MRPFAFELYDRFAAGETIEQISAALGIAAERVATRIRAAEHHLRRKREKAA